MTDRLLPRSGRPAAAAVSVAVSVALACIAAATVGAAPAALPAAPVHTIAIDGMHFSPASVQVHPGERVVWVNKDLVPHTATARDGRFDSKTIAAGASWSWVATTPPGTVAYACVYHPEMTATVTVR